MNARPSDAIRFSWGAAALWGALTLVGFRLNVGGHFPTGFASATFNPQEVGIGSGFIGFVFGAVAGLVIASLQWLVLKAWFPRARLWVLPNAVGYGLVHGLGDAVPYMPLVLVGGGIMLGVTQFFAVRRVLSKPILWMPIVFLAWYGGFQLGFALPHAPQQYPLLVAGLAYGAITGLGLKLLLVPAPLSPATQPSRWASLSLPVKILLGMLFALIVVIYAIMARGLG